MVTELPTGVKTSEWSFCTVVWEFEFDSTSQRGGDVVLEPSRRRASGKKALPSVEGFGWIP